MPSTPDNKCGCTFGYYTCITCNGSGVLLCGRCHGTGIECNGNDCKLCYADKSYKCVQCNGIGRRICHPCHKLTIFGS